MKSSRRKAFKKFLEAELYKEFFHKAIEFFHLADKEDVEAQKEKYERAVKRKKSLVLNKREAIKKAKGRIKTIQFYEELEKINPSISVEKRLKKSRNLGRNADRIIKRYEK